jgi:hypothetical protein
MTSERTLIERIHEFCVQTLARFENLPLQRIRRMIEEVGAQWPPSGLPQTIEATGEATAPTEDSVPDSAPPHRSEALEIREGMDLVTALQFADDRSGSTIPKDRALNVLAAEIRRQRATLTSGAPASDGREGLKPCPFCPGEVYLRANSNHMAHDGEQYHCPLGYCSFDVGTWNRRATSGAALPGALSEDVIKVLECVAQDGEDPCYFDLHGYCQAHGWMSNEECYVATAIRILKTEASPEGARPAHPSDHAFTPDADCASDCGVCGWEAGSE